MTLPTHNELLVVVGQRYPHLDAEKQSSLANAALRVLAEPQWAHTRITPLRAVKIASTRTKKTSF